jgi:hypothetical protein
MFGYGGAGGWPAWAVALMWIGMFAFLGVLIWVGYILMTNATRRPHQQRRGDQGAHQRRSGAGARGVLDERLTRTSPVRRPLIGRRTDRAKLLPSASELP